MSEKLVWKDAEGYINVFDPSCPHDIYDFKVTEAMPADVWIRQLSSKAWVTDAHMRQLRQVLGAQ